MEPANGLSASLARDIAALGRRQEDNPLRRSRTAEHALKRRKGALLAAVCAVAAAAGMTVQGLQQAGKESSAALLVRLGTASIWRHEGSQWEPAQVGASLQSGDAVRTGPASVVRLSFPDGSVVELGPATALLLQRCGYNRESGGRHRSIFVSGGHAWVRLAPAASDDSFFDITTPSAVASGSGSLLSVVAFPAQNPAGMPEGATLVAVHQGGALVSARRGAIRKALSSGQETVIYPNADRAASPAGIFPSEARDWQALATDPGEAAILQPSAASRSRLVDFEEQWLVRPLCLCAAVVHLPVGSVPDDDAEGLNSDGSFTPGAYTKAIMAARTLRNALEETVDGNSGYPAQIGTTDLSGVNLPANKKQEILAGVAGHRVLSYERNDHGYLLYLRARRPSGALIRVTPSGIDAVQE